MRRRHVDWSRFVAPLFCLHCGSSAELDSERSAHSDAPGGETRLTELDGGSQGNAESPAPPTTTATGAPNPSVGTGGLESSPTEPTAAPPIPNANRVDGGLAPVTPVPATGDASVGTTPDPTTTPGGPAGSGPTAPTPDASTPPPLRELSPSAGCALANDDPDESAAAADYVIELQFPATYDGVSPLPLVIGLPTTGGGIVTIPQLSEDYVFAWARAENGLRTWEEMPIEVFGDVYAQLRDSYCFDESRVFGVGHGSGNTYLVSALREYPDTFHAVALHGATPARLLAAPVPALLVHSESEWRGDAQWDDLDGTKAASALSTINECATVTTPSSGGTCGPAATNFACVDYSGCTSALRFCQHDTPTRDPDLWTCFAGDEILSFFDEHL